MTHHPKSDGRFKVYQQINEKIIAQLEHGDIFWRKPWSTRGFLPSNLASKRSYRGFNLFHLQSIISYEQFKSPWFVTFSQCQALGGRIRKGAHGFDIVKFLEAQKEKNQSDEDDGEEDTKKRFFPVAYRVFNTDQTEGLDVPGLAPIPECADKIASCEALLSAMHDIPEIIHGGDQAFYRRFTDTITLPYPHSFRIKEEYYCTCFHEIIHSTGHEHRLNRRELVNHDGFGGANYSREELVGEFGAAYLCGIAGIHPKTLGNSAAYIKSWLDKIKNDPTIIFKASSKAQAAIDFLLPNQNAEGIISPRQAIA